MNQTKVEKLSKSLVKRYDLFNQTHRGQFLGFNVPDCCSNCKEILDFCVKHNVSYNINYYGVLFIFSNNKSYKSELYKNKIIVTQIKD